MDGKSKINGAAAMDKQKNYTRRCYRPVKAKRRVELETFAFVLSADAKGV